MIIATGSALATIAMKLSFFSLVGFKHSLISYRTWIHSSPAFSCWSATNQSHWLFENCLEPRRYRSLEVSEMPAKYIFTLNRLAFSTTDRSLLQMETSLNTAWGQISLWPRNVMKQWDELFQSLQKRRAMLYIKPRIAFIPASFYPSRTYFVSFLLTLVGLER